MFYSNTLNLIQVGGGTQVKQGDLGSKFSYKLANEKNQEIDDFDKEVAHINLVLVDKIVFTTTATVDNSTVTFNIDKAIPVGLYFLEIKIRDYIFPSDKQTIIFVQSGAVAYDLKDLVPNHDVNMTLKGILSDLSQKGIDISDLNRQLAQKANKDEVTNVMTPKGTLAYASLPTSGNQVGWYYYCPDGDGTRGAGNYVWNGTSWFFGGTGDEGYNLLKKDLDERWKNKVYTDELSKYLVRRGNLFDISYSMVGYDIETTNRPSLKYIESNGKEVSDYIPVKAGDVLKINTSITYVCFDKSKVWDEKLRKDANNTTFTIENDGYIRFAYVTSTNPILTKESDKQEDIAYSFEKLNIDPEQIKGNIKIENDELSIFRKYDDFFQDNNFFSYDKDSKPYKATYNGTFKYPFGKTLYDINGDVTLYFLFDATFDFEASNVSKVSEVQYGFNNVNTITKISVDDDGHFTFIGEISGSDLSNVCFEWGFRSFTLKDSNDTEYNIVFTVNTIQLLAIGETYKNKFSNDLLKKLLVAKGINKDGNLDLDNSNYVKHADLSELSNETNFVRTGWYGKKICTFGDSTIAQGRWQPFMAKRLGCTYTNRGIGGTTLCGTGSTCFTHDDRINTIDADADAIVIFGGFNDVGQGLVQNGSFDLSDNISDPSRWNYDPTTVQGAISLLAKKIRAVNPTAPIIFACLPYGFTEISRPSVHKFREYAKEGCYYNGVDFIDMYQLCNWSFDNADSFHPSGDAIHFDDNLGAKRIAGIVCDALMKYEPFN